MKLDSEGGAEANSPKTRYLSTGIAVALALASSHADTDARDGDVGGNTSNRVAGGAGGFKLVGLALGTFVHSQPLGMTMGAYGASMSIYAHFIARGRAIVFPKNTAMEIGIGTRNPRLLLARRSLSTPIRRNSEGARKEPCNFWSLCELDIDKQTMSVARDN